MFDPRGAPGYGYERDDMGVIQTPALPVTDERRTWEWMSVSTDPRDRKLLDTLNHLHSR